MFELYEKKRTNINILIIIALVTVFSVMIAVKLFSLQIVNHDYHLDQVIDNIQKEGVIKADLLRILRVKMKRLLQRDFQRSLELIMTRYMKRYL